MERLRINYREFWDVPRIFITTYAGKHYLFDCPFDQNLDDYPDAYRVYEMPPLSESLLSGDWLNLSEKSTRLVGIVPVDAVKFDHTKRTSIAASIFTEMLQKPGLKIRHSA